jgi:hypothetical protein
MATVQRSGLGPVAFGVALALAGCGQVADGGASESSTGGGAPTANPTSGGGGAPTANPASGGGASGASSASATAGRTGIVVPVPVATPGEKTSCGVLWGAVDPSALPADGVLVGSYNGTPFEIPAERVLADLECPSPLSEPPALHMSFELEAEQLVFVIRGCTAFVYLPDLSAIDLTMSAEATVEPNGVDGSTAAGHWVLRAAATATTPEITVEFSLSAPMGAPLATCIG